MVIAMKKSFRLLLLSLFMAFLVWLSAITQGVYFGVRMVRWFYKIGATVYDRVKNNQPADDSANVGRPLSRLLAESGAAPQVLDIATGTGRLPITLLAEPEFAGRIVGVDLSREMLRLAARKTAGGRVSLVNALAVPLPFDDHSFDCVTSLEATELMPDPRAAIREMVRVLRPGGWLAITNRIGVSAHMMPLKVEPTATVMAFLAQLGMTDIATGARLSYWGVEFYVLLYARKPVTGSAAVDNGDRGIL